MDCAARKPKSTQKISVFGKVIIGGASAAALAFRCNRFVVSCSANRLAGTIQRFALLFRQILNTFLKNSNIPWISSDIHWKKLNILL